MQINITQYVLVRIPRNMGLFDVKPDIFNMMSYGLRTRLLDEGQKADAEEDDKDEEKDKQPKTALGKLLKKI